MGELKIRREMKGEIMIETEVKDVNELEVGDMVRHKIGVNGYVVMAKDRDRVTAARLVDITHANEWIKISRGPQFLPGPDQLPEMDEEGRNPCVLCGVYTALKVCSACRRSWSENFPTILNVDVALDVMRWSEEQADKKK